MLAKLRSRLTYANVMSTIACFGVLATGTAYAANTVFSTDIVDGEVKSVDVGDAEIKSADVKDQSLTTFDVSTFLGVDVVDNTLTGADVNESTLKLGTEPWKEVGTDIPWSGSSTFCHYTNYAEIQNGSTVFDSAGFARDSAGFVHLKGLIMAQDGATPDGEVNTCEEIPNRVFFRLPAGYRPAKEHVAVTLSNDKLARVDVHGDVPFLEEFAGQVRLRFPPAQSVNGDWSDAKTWISLDGISFRCAPSGQDGCP